MAAYTASLSMAKRKERRGTKPVPSERPPSPEAPPASVVSTDAERVESGAPLLFCPFCREAFEGETRCPDHDLSLVSWDELPKAESDTLSEDDAVTPIELRYGRGELFAGVVLSMISVLSPLFTVRDGDQARTFSLLAAATDRAPNLWTVPFVAALVLSITLRRRTIRQMLGARLALLILASGPLISLGYSFYKITTGAAELGAQVHRTLVVDGEWGMGLVIAGAVLMGIGAFRFGVQRATDQRSS